MAATRTAAAATAPGTPPPLRPIGIGPCFGINMGSGWGKLLAVFEPDEEAARVAAAFCRVVAETVTGRRPYTQPRPALGPRPATVVADLLRGPRLEVLRATRVRHQVPRGGVIEASARLCSPRASCALALRLERFEVGWVAVALEAALIGDTRPRR